MTGAHRTVALLGVFGSQPSNCFITPLEPGNAPSAYSITCDESHEAQIAVGERDENLRILDYVADPVVGPNGRGTVEFTAFQYDTPTSSRLTGWTEIRTFESSGNEHTLVVSDIQRLSGGVFIYTVDHTRPDGTTRRYDFLPFE